MEHTLALTPQRRQAVKFAFTTRRVPAEVPATVLAGERVPRPGDLVLARVAELGQHERIERPDGRRARLFPGDEVVVAYGHRYAPDQFEADVPADLGPCHLVAAGGLAARVVNAHEAMDVPTVLEPVGLVGDAAGRAVNLAHWALPARDLPDARPPVIAVAGTSMNSGKTTTAAHLILGLSRAGHRVGAAKVTGTGAGGDLWLFGDAGARPVLDFTDAGWPSTYRAGAHATAAVFSTLVAHLAATGVEAIVLEVADGVFQDETAALLADPRFARGVDRVVFAAGDAMGATAGVRMLRRHGLPVVAVSGTLTMSPLARREARGARLPVLGRDELAGPGVAAQLLEGRSALALSA